MENKNPQMFKAVPSDINQGEAQEYRKPLEPLRSVSLPRPQVRLPVEHDPRDPRAFKTPVPVTPTLPQKPKSFFQRLWINIFGG